ncbi:MAG TPA: peptide ABC transporter substrate-binding protein [Pyrinomonadaceae bacterium]|jgi:oligopeptide transport system substrate-binding protein
MSKKRSILQRKRHGSTEAFASLVVVASLLFAGCFRDSAPSGYYGKIVVPRAQEFRWSDGGLPQTFDPAFAAAPPDTDAVRALFEGLTDYDPVTLAAVPGVATRWESSPDARVWTFYLREDAKWSNGENVTAADFVRSWQRTLKIGPLAPHTDLLSNIEGSGANPAPPKTEKLSKQTPIFGAEALSDHVLRVRLHESDAAFPALVAHPVFRPVKVLDANTTNRLEADHLVSNGAFQLSGKDGDRVLLERAKTYWDGASVSLQRVSFIGSSDAEDALAAYRTGDVDAVTNAAFEPLALKLLSGYRDFRRSTFGALTYYSFNASRAPFDDVRVRQALAIAIDRERVSQDHLGGATEPAGKFFPDEMSGEKPVVNEDELIEQDIARARGLLSDAGFPDGAGFPTIRLLINRNDQQRIVAQAIAAMWRSALGVNTEVVIKNWDEYELAVKGGDYDVVRRGMVMQTTDELTNLRMLFERETVPVIAASIPSLAKPGEAVKPDAPVVTTENEALKELRAVPIYFASSFALVKPYVNGFGGNVLDAPSLKRTRINTGWTERQP